MATIKYVEESQATGLVKEIFAQIKQAYGMPFVPNLFKAMANWPAYLESFWSRSRVIMGSGQLDRKTKEIIALAVSATNGCEYCINAHTAALKRMGLDDGALTELMAVVDMFNGLNKFLDGLKVDSDIKPS